MKKHKEEFTKIKQYRGEVFSAIHKNVRFGFILMILFVVGFGGWAVFARIDKAAVATGEIVSSDSNKVVQHLEGGVIEKILVHEGDRVKAGDVLVKLSSTSATANKEIYVGALYTGQAELARLNAERDGIQAVKYPDEWYKNPDVFKPYMDTQNKIFQERNSGYQGKLNVLDEKTNQMQSEIKGMKSQLAAARTQLQYTISEQQTVERLLQNGNTTMSRLLELKAKHSEIEGRIGALNSEIAKGEQGISENKLNKINVKNDFLNEVVQQIKEVQAKTNEFKERGSTATDTLTRTEIRAPISGVVKDMKYKTADSSGVIPPNGEVLTIVPEDGKMVAEVKIAINDIDIVRKPNLKTKVRLSAYSARHIPMLEGVLQFVSADSFKDERNQQSYYKGRVSIDTSPLKKYLGDKPEIEQSNYLYPGMPVEVYIITGERSPMSYLLDPIRNDMRKSFREE